MSSAIDSPHPDPAVVLGSAVDQRTSALLDPSLLGNDHVRRRGSDFGRARTMPLNPSAEPQDAFELQTIARLRKEQAERTPEEEGDEDDIEVYKRTSEDIEAVPVTETAATSAAVSIRDDSSTAAIVSDSERRAHNRRSAVHYAALCWCFFLCGWNDGTTGPLLPRIQEHYGIGFTIVSMLFVANTCGFIIGAVANVRLSDQLGFGKVLVLGAVFEMIAYSLLSPAGPFPLMCIAFLCAGFGLALLNSQGNTYVTNMRDAPTKIGVLHASYGLGAFCAPLLSTHFATQEQWSYHYLVSLGIAALNTIFLVTAFRFKNLNDVMSEAGLAQVESDVTGKGKYKQIWSITAVHFLAIWALIYIGVEVTLGGWIVTYIQQRRGGGASAGYISSGFFGGLMLGRVSLLWLNRKIGERRVMFLYAFLAIQLQVTVWVVPSLVENAVAVSLIGLVLGPMYPIQVNHSKQIIPKWLFPGSIGWITGIGMTGSAMLPFFTGLLASKFGISSLQPFIVSMMSCLVVIWALVPRIRRVD